MFACCGCSAGRGGTEELHLPASQATEPAPDFSTVDLEPHVWRAAEEAEDEGPSSRADQPGPNRGASHVPVPLSSNSKEAREWVQLGGVELEQALENKWVGLVRADWLVKKADEEAGVLMRRQDMPAEAYISLNELKQAGISRYIPVTRVMSDDHFEPDHWLRVIVLSYPWLQPGHPDPHGENLRRIAKVLRCFLGTLRDDSDVEDGEDADDNSDRDNGPFGVLIDFASLFQTPRTPEENRVFKDALPALGVFYSHPHTVVLKLTTHPDGYPSTSKFKYSLPEGANKAEYAERGWCFAESSMSGLVKSSALVFDLASYSGGWDLDSCTVRRTPPLHPEEFRKALSRKKFASKSADFEKVDELYSKAFEHRLGLAELRFHRLGWRGEEVQQLTEALKSSRLLQRLYLSSNPMGDQGAEALAALLRSNQTLQTLDLSACSIGDKGVLALGQALQSESCSLQSLDLGDNPIEIEGARALGKALKQKTCSLQTLDLRGNRFRSKGALAFKEALKQSSVLRVLNLGEDVESRTRETLSRVALADAHKVELRFDPHKVAAP